MPLREGLLRNRSHLPLFGKEQHRAAVGTRPYSTKCHKPGEFLTALKETTQPFLRLKI